MPYILALDQGTTSSRAIVFDHAGTVQALAQQELQALFPHPGWIEQDPHAIWSSQLEVTNAALAKAGLSSNDIAAIGITNQRETTLIWERQSGRPIYNAIVWQDRRAAGICHQLQQEGLGPYFRERTGLVLDPYFSGTKVRWLLDNVTGARTQAEDGALAFGTVDSWLLWHLTQGEYHLTDATNASRTLLYNIHTGDWDEDLLERLQIPRSLLPEVKGSSELYATTTLGSMPDPIPIAGVAGDQHAALFGQACTARGMGKNTYGTGCFLLMYTGAEPMIGSRHNLLTTLAWQMDGKNEYALEGSVFTAGAVVQWLRDGLGLIRSATEVERLAAQVPDNGGVYLVPAFTGLGAPHWDPHARGTIIGLTQGSTASHLARAALEAIAYQTTDVLRAMEADADIRIAELRVDGGATANELLMQFQADLLGVPVIRPRVLETTALGAAFLAGLAVGYWRDRSELAVLWEAERVFEPQLSPERVTPLLSGWQRALERAKGWTS